MRMTVYGIVGNAVCRIASGAVLIVVLSVSDALAQEVAPDLLLKAATMDMIAIIKQDEGIHAGNPGNTIDRVETRMLPIFDFMHMIQIAMGRHWRKATPMQQQALAMEFKLMLVRNYTATMTGYRDWAIEFKPLRTSAEDTQVTVKSVIKQPGVGSQMLNYDMEKQTTEWKVYDIKINGRSLISAYREAFAGKVREGGVEGLLVSLAETNRRGDTGIRLYDTEAIYFPVVVWRILQGTR